MSVLNIYEIEQYQNIINRKLYILLNEAEHNLMDIDHQPNYEDLCRKVEPLTMSIKDKQEELNELIEKLKSIKE